jgi:mRNA interferase MazF
MAAWVPESGEIVWVNFNPQAGHEQAGHRPALVLSPARYNGLRGMMLCCPLTAKLKGYPFEVAISQEPPSAILADQVKSLDWRARKARRQGKVTAVVMAEVRAKLKALLQI